MSLFELWKQRSPNPNTQDYSTSPSTQTGRRVEKWEDKNGSRKLESEDKLFNYVSPQSFIVSEKWYKNICGINYGK